jgi:alkanesulfonate monooxygenase SsuD/methylene tetrahydromethanopterin reductase-like flavin-dependent oxidoreductase (luciferase family)
VTLGAVAQVTGRAELMTYVTCPTMRYHPAVVAQQAATLAVLSDNRFTLGLGAGENLNEHVIGEGWPDADQRQEMLAEAVGIIRALLDGGYVNFEGAYFRVDAARIWDLPGRAVPLGVAVSGQQSCELFAPLAEVMIAVEPDGSLAGWWDAASGNGRPARKVGQMPICWGPDREECIRRAHEQFRWFGPLLSSSSTDATAALLQPRPPPLGPFPPQPPWQLPRAWRRPCPAGPGLRASVTRSRLRPRALPWLGPSRLPRRFRRLPWVQTHSPRSSPSYSPCSEAPAPPSGTARYPAIRGINAAGHAGS